MRRKMKIKEQDAYDTYVQCEIRYPKECSTPITKKMTNAEKEAFEQRKKKREGNHKYYEYIAKYDAQFTDEYNNNYYGYSID